jgi:putative membrane protein
VNGLGYAPPLSVLAGAAALQAVYVLCVDVYRDRFPGAAPVSARTQATFSAGVLVLLVALASPLDLLGDTYLFSAHMLQHLLLTLAAAPLLLAGTPGWLLRGLLNAAHLTRLARWLRQPLLALGIFNLVFALAHLPSVYEATLASEPLHAFEHVVFLATAIVMWLPVLSPAEDVLPRYPALGQVLYLFLQTMPASLVGGLLSVSGQAVYPTYVAAPRITGLSPYEDQQLGGLLMWVGCGVYFLLATAVVFFVWASREEAANRRPVGVI